MKTPAPENDSCPWNWTAWPVQCLPQSWFKYMAVLVSALICCEVSKCFWKLLKTTNSWKPRYECYPLLVHVPLPHLMVHRIWEDTLFISPPRIHGGLTLVQVHFITLMFLKWWKMSPCYCPNTLLFQVLVLISQQCKLCGLVCKYFCFTSMGHRAEKAHFLQTRMIIPERPRNTNQNSKDNSQASIRAHSTSLFLAVKYLLVHSLLLQMVGRLLLC